MTRGPRSTSLPARLTVLFLASDPFGGHDQRRLEDEVHAIRRVVESDGASGRIQMAARFVTRPSDLRDALLRHDARIVHLSGHGDAPGALCLADEHGRRRRVGAAALAELFGSLRAWIRMVVVNGRDTLRVTAALGEVVDYAIGMDRPITDSAAIGFCGAFYAALAMGRPVRAAFAAGLREMEMDASDGFGIPVLRVRPGVDAAVPLIAPETRGTSED